MDSADSPPAGGPAGASKKPHEAEIFGYARRYERYAGVVAVLIVLAIIIHAIVAGTSGGAGLNPGTRVPPFAVPLALGAVNGDANVATRANDGAAGRKPACSVRGPQILNVCELYERGPAVIALFVNAGTCPGILRELQALAPSFPGVSFAAVAIRGSRQDLRARVRSDGVGLPVGWDRDGALAALYNVVSCPEVTFVYPGGTTQGRALFGTPTPAALRARVLALLAASRTRGWRPPAS